MDRDGFWRRHDTVMRIYDWADRFLGLSGLITSAVIAAAVAMVAYIRDWDPLAIFLAMLCTFVPITVLYLEFSRLWDSGRSASKDRNPVRAEMPSEFAEDIPDLRVADSPFAISLFEGAERDKLLPLLEAERVRSWARPMRGEKLGEDPAPVILKGDIWRTHYLLFAPKQAAAQRSQTFLKTKNGHESTYYDVFLNRSQIEKLWRERVPLYEAATRAYERIRHKDISILAEGLTDSSPEEILSWYSDRLCRPYDNRRPIKLFGTRPPSRTEEEIYLDPLNNYDFVVEGMAIIIQERNGKTRYENLRVNEKEADAAIECLESLSV